MIISYDHFIEKLNKKLFEGSSADLLDKIAKNPDRYIGIFRPTKPRTKIIQNITQSHEIKFGDALENIFEEYFEKMGFKLLPKLLSSNETDDNEEYSIDQLFEKGEIIYLVEQKVRDDHDSTKKKGQFQNFENKFYEVSRKYPNKNIIPIMWFIDPSLKKNRRYYLEEMEKLANDYGCNPKLYYGEDLFDSNEDGIKEISYEMWIEITDYLIRWKETLPEMPEINLDNSPLDVFEEIKDIEPSIYRKLFDNEEIIKQIFPIIFPNGEVLDLLKNYYRSKYNKEIRTTKIYNTLADKIENYLEYIGG